MITQRYKLFTTLIIVGLFSIQTLSAQTITWDGSSSNSWNTAANWDLNRVPLSTDDVVIPNGFDVDIDVAGVCNSFIIEGGGTDNTVSITGANSLTVTNGFTIESGTGFGDLKQFNVGVGTLTCASIDMDAAAGFNRGTQLTISTGTVNVTGDITIGTRVGLGADFNDFTFTDAGTVNVGGSFTGGEFTASTGTVNYNGSNQTINNAYTYNNLEFNGDGDASMGGAVTVGGNFSVDTPGSLDFGGFTHTISGNWVYDAGTLDLTGSTIDLNGAGQSIGGTLSTTFDDLTLSGSGTKTFDLSTAVSGTLAISTGVVADLGTFTDHTTNALSLGNVGQASGSWGSSSSGATNPNDVFFAATTGFVTAAVTGPTTFFSIATGNWGDAATWSNESFAGAAASTSPLAGDIVNIGGGLTVTVNAASAAGSIDFQEGDGANSPVLTIAGTNTLDVSGTITIPRGGTFLNPTTNTLAVGAGTLNAGNIALEGGGATGTNALTLSTGTVTVTGDVSSDNNDIFTLLGAATNLTFTDAGTLQVAGNLFDSEQGTLTPSTGTVEFNGTSAQQMGDLNYFNLTLTGSGTKTPVGVMNVDGDLTLASGSSFTAGAFNHLLAGNWVNNGGTFTSTSSTITFDGTTQSIGGSSNTIFQNLTIAANSTTTFTNPTTINATLAINGTGGAEGVADLNDLTSHSAKTLSFDGTGQAPGTWGTVAAADPPFESDLYFASTAGTITVTNTIYFTRANGNWNDNNSWSTATYGGAAAGAGLFPLAGDIALIGNANTITVTGADAAVAFIEFETDQGETNTLTLSGQTLTVSDNITIAASDGDTNTMNVADGTLNVGDLTFIPNNAGTPVTALTISTGTATITGDVVNSGPDIFFGIQNTATITFSGAGTLSVAGSFLDSGTGTLTPSTGTVEYNGTSPQTIGDFTYNNLTFNNTAASIPDLTLAGNITVNSTLTMTSGIVDLAGFTLSLGNAGASTLNRTASTTTNWTYGGTFARFWVATAITSNSGNNYGLFPIGSDAASSYRPVEFNSTTTPTTTGTVSVSHTDFSGTTTLAPPFVDNDLVSIEVKDNSNFTVTNAVTDGDYDVSMTMTGLGGGTLDDYRLAKNDGATTVTTVGTHVAASGTGTSPTVSRSGVAASEIAGDWRVASTDVAGTPLPVDLIRFEVTLVGNDANLQWTTAQELNNDRFEIEHSHDGLTFELIGVVNGNGTVNEISSYSFTHQNPSSGLHYYRLKQVDFDGQFAHSEIKRVNVGTFESVIVTLYPNPAHEIANITLSEGSITSIQLINSNGSLLRATSIAEGISSYLLDVSDLASGIYFIRIQGPGVNTVDRLMISDR